VFRALFLVNMTFPIPIPFSQSFLLLLHLDGSDKPHKPYCTHLILVYGLMLAVVIMVVATNQFLKDCVYLKPPPRQSDPRYAPIYACTFGHVTIYSVCYRMYAHSIPQDKTYFGTYDSILVTVLLNCSYCY
jgi:hypothetical protein